MALRNYSSFAVAMALAACGGGGSSSPPPAPPPPPSISLTLSSTNGGGASLEGEASTFALAATATPRQTATTPIVPVVTFDQSLFLTVAVSNGPAANTYAITATTRADIGGGDLSGAITLRLCTDSACSTVYPGATATYTHTLTVRLKDWTTFQRDAAHTGYVRVTLDPAKFAKAWEWSNPDTGSYGNAVVTGGGAAYSTTYNGKVSRFNESTGAIEWAYDTAPNVYSIGPGAYRDGAVYIPAHYFANSTHSAHIWGIDAQTGQFKSDSTFEAQFSALNSPTIDGDSMFYSLGYQGGQIYKYSLPSGKRAWVSTYINSNAWDGQSPAISGDQVFYITNLGLAIYDKASGSLVANIADPQAFFFGYGYPGGPHITSSGRAVYTENTNNGRALIGYDTVLRTIAWRLFGEYQFKSATAKGVIYTVRRSPVAALDAIDERTGIVIWSWTLPAGGGNFDFEANPVVTDNLVFVSSQQSTYAVDLSTHQSVWSHPEHGLLSLSAGYVLYIVPRVVPHRIIAIRLR